ncbi:MAG TPA: hypothetical protein VF771_12365, partial [Longimicrobiaceae bacterium]
DLYSVPLAGGANTRLTTTPRDETAPALSPDGQKLAYGYFETDIPKLYLANANGSNAQRALPASAGDFTIETSPAWGPSSALAFVSTSSGTADIYRMVGTAAPSLLAGGNATAEVEPALSADGQTLAFVSNRTGGTEIFLLRVATGAVTQLTSGPGSKVQPAWTPDGRLVYVESISGATRLRWLDLATPGTLNLIDTGAGAVGHPVAVAGP